MNNYLPYEKCKIKEKMKNSGQIANFIINFFKYLYMGNK